jgi:hypothetical protein
MFKAFMDELNPFTNPQYKKQIKSYIKEDLANPYPVVNFGILTEIHFVRYVLSIRKRNGDLPKFSTYSGHRAGFSHLYTIFKMEKSRELENELAIYFKSLRKRSAKAAQNGSKF